MASEARFYILVGSKVRLVWNDVMLDPACAVCRVDVYVTRSSKAYVSNQAIIHDSIEYHSISLYLNVTWAHSKAYSQASHMHSGNVGNVMANITQFGAQLVLVHLILADFLPIMLAFTSVKITSRVYAHTIEWGVCNRWTGLLDWTTGLDYWTDDLTTESQFMTTRN